MKHKYFNGEIPKEVIKMLTQDEKKRMAELEAKVQKTPVEVQELEALKKKERQQQLNG